MSSSDKKTYAENGQAVEVDPEDLTPVADEPDADPGEEGIPPATEEEAEPDPHEDQAQWRPLPIDGGEPLDRAE